MAAKKKAKAKAKAKPKKAAAPKKKKLLKATPAIKAAAAKSAKKAAKGAKIGKAGYDAPAKKKAATPARVTLYGFHLSLPSCKVGLMLSMLGVEWDYRHVDLQAGAHKAPEYAKINRFMQVPALVNGGEAIVQSNVILQHLAERFGAFGGANAHEKRRIAEWLAWDFDRMAAIRQVRFLRRFVPDSHALPMLFETGAQALELLDRHLGTSKFVAGPNPTIADVALFPTIATAEEAQYDAAKYPNIRDWGQRMMKLPGVAHPYALMPKEDRVAA